MRSSPAPWMSCMRPMSWMSGGSGTAASSSSHVAPKQRSRLSILETSGRQLALGRWLAPLLMHLRAAGDLPPCFASERPLACLMAQGEGLKEAKELKERAYNWLWQCCLFLPYDLMLHPCMVLVDLPCDSCKTLFFKSHSLLLLHGFGGAAV